MKRIAFGLFILVFSTSLFAQATRTYIKSTGSDSNVSTFCSDPLNPCRHFQNAHDNTVAGGEILVLDAGFYGPLNITKSIHVTAPDGVTAGIVAPTGGAGVTIAAGSTDTVELSHLRIVSGGNANATGILLTGGGYLEVYDTAIQSCKFGVHLQHDTRALFRNLRIGGFTDGAGGGIGFFSDGLSTSDASSQMRILIVTSVLAAGDTAWKTQGGALEATVGNGVYVFDVINAQTTTANVYQNCYSVTQAQYYTNQYGPGNVFPTNTTAFACAK